MNSLFLFCLEKRQHTKEECNVVAINAEKQLDEDYIYYKQAKETVFCHDAELKNITDFLSEIDAMAYGTSYIHYLSWYAVQYNNNDDEKTKTEIRKHLYPIRLDSSEQLRYMLGLLPPYNIEYTPNLYWKAKAGQSNKKDYAHLAQINVVELDIDGIYESGIPTIEVVNKLLVDIEHNILELPMPNWVEYGRNARFIYILKEPIKLRHDKAHRQLMIDCVNAIGREYCKTIKLYCIGQRLNLNPEVQQPHKTNRVPGAFNRKGAETHLVHLFKVSDTRYTFQDHLHYWCPALEYTAPSTTKKKKNITVSKKGNISYIHSTPTMLMNRLATLESIRNEVDYDRHEYLTFIWLETWKALNPNYTTDEIKSALLNFVHSIHDYHYTDKVIISKMQSNFKKDTYHFKNETICDYLGICNDTFSANKRNKERIDKVQSGNTRVQNADAQYQTVKTLYEQGIKRKEIVDITGLNINTVKKYITKIRNGEEHFANMDNLENRLYKSKK